MTPESQWAIGLAIGAGVAVVNGLMLPGRDRRSVARAMGVGGLVGAILFPIGVGAYMGFSRAIESGYLAWKPFFWEIFWNFFWLYARAAPFDSVPRGAVIGLFGGLTWVLWRVKPKQRPQSGHPLDPDPADIPHPTPGP